MSAVKNRTICSRIEPQSDEVIREGKFKRKFSLSDPLQERGTIVFDTDEGPRDTDLKSMAKLKSVFKEGGVVTAANSPRSDGASALVLMSKKKRKPLASSPWLKSEPKLQQAWNWRMYWWLRFSQSQRLLRRQAFLLKISTFLKSMRLFLQHVLFSKPSHRQG